MCKTEQTHESFPSKSFENCCYFCIQSHCNDKINCLQKKVVKTPKKLKNQKVRVALRYRPHRKFGESKIFASQEIVRKNFNDDNIFFPPTKTTHLYQNKCTDFVNELFAGFSVCILAYGQTGSGKTHTMYGTKSDPGLVRLFVDNIFKKKEQYSTQWSITISASFFEIYLEKVYDLINHTNKGLQIKQNMKTKDFLSQKSCGETDSQL